MVNNEIKTYDSDQSCLVKFQMTFSHERKCRILHIENLTSNFHVSINFALSDIKNPAYINSSTLCY